MTDHPFENHYDQRNNIPSLQDQPAHSRTPQHSQEKDSTAPLKRSRSSDHKFVSTGNKITKNNGNCLYVSKLSPHFNDEDLRKLFSKYGKIEYANICYQPYSEQQKGKKISCGYGFVKYSSQDSAEKAIDDFLDQRDNQKSIKVEFSKRGAPHQQQRGPYFNNKRRYGSPEIDNRDRMRHNQYPQERRMQHDFRDSRRDNRDQKFRVNSRERRRSIDERDRRRDSRERRDSRDRRDSRRRDSRERRDSRDRRQKDYKEVTRDNRIQRDRGNYSPRRSSSQPHRRDQSRFENQNPIPKEREIKRGRRFKSKSIEPRYERRTPISSSSSGSSGNIRSKEHTSRENAFKKR